MGILYITEFSTRGILSPTMATEPPVAEQTVTYSTSTSSNAFNPDTILVCIHTDSICSIEFGTNPTATTTTRRMAANQTEYFEVPRGLGYKVAAITNT